MIIAKHYRLKIFTMAEDIEKIKKKIKTTNLGKIRKWWVEIEEPL